MKFSVQTMRRKGRFTEVVRTWKKRKRKLSEHIKFLKEREFQREIRKTNSFTPKLLSIWIWLVKNPYDTQAKTVHSMLLRSNVLVVLPTSYDKTLAAVASSVIRAQVSKGEVLLTLKNFEPSWKSLHTNRFRRWIADVFNQLPWNVIFSKLCSLKSNQTF